MLGCCLLQALLAATVSTRVCAADETASPRFEITLDPQIASQPIDGRLYLFLSQRGGQPIRGPDWFRPEPFARLDVKNFRPGETRTIDDRAAAFPDVIAKFPTGTYRAQAVLDDDFYDPRPADGVGNLYCEVIEITIGEPPAERTDESQPAKANHDAQVNNASRNGHKLTLALRLTKRIESILFPESKWVKEIVLKSELLEQFHKREVVERAAVVLPASYYDEPLRRYPVVYVIPGFGGSHRDGLRYATMAPSAAEGETEFIRVYLSGRCKWGHHVYADSATNGPRGEALVREMIPLIDREFRTVAESTARFVMGHSSGGWSSLWLQVTYPETFGGVWSSSPDPVDLRDFQQINLYADPPQNMYRDTHGERRPIARRGEAPSLWFDSFTKMDDVIGRGGQLRSFEAVFSPLDGDRLAKAPLESRNGPDRSRRSQSLGEVRHRPCTQARLATIGTALGR